MLVTETGMDLKPGRCTGEEGRIKFPFQDIEIGQIRHPVISLGQ
jgi:hypothetical protein